MGRGRYRVFSDEERKARAVAANKKWRAEHGYYKPKPSLARDLRLLAYVIRIIRGKLQKPDLNRKRALAAYHEKAPVYNERRRLGAAALTVAREWESRHGPQESPLLLLAAANRVIARHHRRRNKAVRAKLVKILRRRLENVVKRLKIPIAGLSESARKLTGATLEELREHLEKQFKPGMCWANHGYTGWHVDHIKPLAAFDLRDESQQREAFHYTNLQPLWASENLEKRDKF